MKITCVFHFRQHCAQWFPLVTPGVEKRCVLVGGLERLLSSTLGRTSEKHLHLWASSCLSVFPLTQEVTQKSEVQRYVHRLQQK